MNTSTRIAGKCALFLLMFAPCAFAADKSVEDANAAWDRAFNKADPHALAALYDEHAVVSPGNGTTVQGRENIAKLFKGFFDAGARDHATHVVHANHTGNVMYETANWTAVLGSVSL